MSADFEDLVEKYHRLVYALIHKYYQGDLRDQLDDLSQEIWLKLWDRFQKNERNIVDFKSYLYRTVQTTLWDALRQVEKERVDVDLDHPQAHGIEGEVQDREGQLDLSLLMRHLKDEERRMVRAYLQGFTYEEIAALLGCGEGRVRNLLSRIKKKLALLGG